MECPECNKPILSSSERCTSCGYPYPEDVRIKISVYFDLRREMEALKSTLKTNVWPGLQRISGKIDLLEKTLDADLEMLAVPEEEIIVPHPAEEAMPEQAAMPQQTEQVREMPVSVVPVLREKAPLYWEKEKKDGSEFEIRLGQKWLLIVGIVTMVFGIGYFLKYSFDRGWIGPAGRVAMAYLWGLVLLAGGNSFRKKFETFGLYVIGGGIATLYFSTFAGFQIYHLFGQIPSFFVMTMITVLACALSVVHDAKWLAVLGLIGGFFTPVMLSTGQDNQIVLMTYMTILNFGLLGIAFYKKWDLLNYLGFVFTYLLFSVWFSAHYQDSKFWPTIIFLNIFYLTYSLIPFAYSSLRGEGQRKGTFPITAFNSFIAFGFGYEMIRRYASLEWVSVITLFYAFVSLVMARYLYKKGEQAGDAFIMLSAKTALFLIITVPIIFSNHWITIFWAAQALTLLWAGLRLERKPLLAGSYILLGLAVGKFLMHDYSQVFGWDQITWSIQNSYTHLLAERLLTSVLIILVVRRFSVMLGRVYGEAFSVFTENDSGAFSILAGILIFICTNVEISSFFYEYFPLSRPAALCILWAVQSFVLFWIGLASEKKTPCILGYVLFALAAMKFMINDYTNIYHFSPSLWAIPGSYMALFFQRAVTAVVLLTILRLSSRLLRATPVNIVSSSLGIEREHLLHDALFGVLLFAILNVETASYFYVYVPAARFAAVSVLWALFSVALMAKGFSGKSLFMRRISLGLFSVTLVKVFMFDMANVGTPYRIVSFIVLGLLLVGTSYLYHRFKDRIMGGISDEDKDAETVR